MEQSEPVPSYRFADPVEVFPDPDERGTQVPEEPAILTANTFYWTPAGPASCRRANERKQVGTVAEWFRAIGGTIETVNDERVSATWNRNGEAIQATFSYSESCKNVYKSLHVTRNGKRSTIRVLRQIAAEVAADRVSK